MQYPRRDMNAKRGIGLLCALALCGSGCLSEPVCPPFATIVAGDFGYLGDTRWWTLEVEQIPATFTVNQSEVPVNFLEYRWAVDIDSDGDVDMVLSRIDDTADHHRRHFIADQPPAARGDGRRRQ